MPIGVRSNILSTKVQRRLGETTSSLSNVFQRLSSGQRITRAADDAAGLAITAQLNTNSRVQAQGVRNINDGLSQLNIAEQALQALSSITMRQFELAQQSANGTLSATQRQALNNEASALTNEYNRILATTQYNGTQIFTDSGSTLTIQAGSGAQAAVSLALGQQLSGAAPSSSFSVAASPLAEVTEIDFSGTSKPYADIAFSDAEWTPSGTQETTSLFFQDGTYYSGGESFQLELTPGAGYTTFYFVVDSNGSGSGTPIYISSSDSADDIAGAVTNELGLQYATNFGGGQVVFYAMDFGDTLDAQGGTNISVNTDTQGDTFNVSNYSSGSYILFQDGSYAWFYVDGVGSDPLAGPGDSFQINITTGVTTASDIVSSFTAFGDLTVSQQSSNTARFQMSSLLQGSALTAYDSIGYSVVNDVTGSGVNNGSYFTFHTPEDNYYVYWGDSDPLVPGVAINVSLFHSTIGSMLSELVTAINAVAPVTASVDGNKLIITNDTVGSVIDASSLPISLSFLPSVVTQGTDSGNIAGDQITYFDHGLTTGQRIQLTSSAGVPGGLSTGVDYYAIVDDTNTFRLATSESNALSNTAITLLSSGTGMQVFTAFGPGSGMTVQASAIDLTTAASAQEALTALNARLNRIGAELGAQGAFQSRLQSAARHSTTLRDAYVRASSAISSADVAVEAAQLARLSVVQQSATALLAQANASPQLVLQLLR